MSGRVLTRTSARDGAAPRHRCGEGGQPCRGGSPAHLEPSSVCAVGLSLHRGSAGPAIGLGSGAPARGARPPSWCPGRTAGRAWLRAARGVGASRTEARPGRWSAPRTLMYDFRQTRKSAQALGSQPSRLPPGGPDSRVAGVGSAPDLGCAGALDQRDPRRMLGPATGCKPGRSSRALVRAGAHLSRPSARTRSSLQRSSRSRRRRRPPSQ